MGQTTRSKSRPKPAYKIQKSPSQTYIPNMNIYHIHVHAVPKHNTATKNKPIFLLLFTISIHAF